MPRRVVERGADFVRGNHEGLGVTIKGRVFPVDRNLLPDPRFKAFSQDGSLDGWDYPNYPLPFRGYNIYVRKPGAASRTRIRLDTDQPAIYVYREPPSTIFMPPAPSGILAPSSPRLVAYNGTPPLKWGWMAGWYGVAYALVRNGRMTGTSPRGTNEIADDWGSLELSISLDATQVTRATEVAIFVTEPQVDEAAAMAAPLSLQDVVAIDTRTLLEESLIGPWRAGEGASGNGTYGGNVGPLEWRFAPVSAATLQDLAIDLSWTYTTRSGRSASQAIVQVDASAQIGTALAVQPPFKPHDALTWRAEWRQRGVSGKWLAYNDSLDFDSPQYIYSMEPITGTILVDPTITDATGLPNPTLEPTVGLEFDLNGLAAGSWRVSATALYPVPGSTLPFGELPLVESGPSEESLITVSQWGAIRADLRTPPSVGNRFFNPEGNERVRVDGVARGAPAAYTFHTSVTGDVEDRVISVTDASASNTAQDVMLLDPASVREVPHVLRIALQFGSTSAGTLRILMRQLDSGLQMLAEDEVFATSTGEDLPETEITFAPVEFAADHPLDPDCAYLRLIAVHDGSATPRNLDWTMQVDLHEGYAAPRKGVAGGYVEVIEDPVDRPEELDGLDLNALEYFGGWEEPLLDTAHPKGLAVPVRGGQWYGISTYCKPRGLEDGSQLFLSAFYDKKDRLVQTNQPLVQFEDRPGPFVQGEMSITSDEWERHFTALHAPPQATFLKITGNKLGRGRLRVMGFQFEKGVSLTDFDPGVADEDVTGEWGYVESLVDLSPTMPDEGPQTMLAVRPLMEISGGFRFNVVGEGILGAEFSSGPSEDGPWSDPVADPNDMPVSIVNHWVKIRLRLGGEEAGP